MAAVRHRQVIGATICEATRRGERHSVDSPKGPAVEPLRRTLDARQKPDLLKPLKHDGRVRPCLHSARPHVECSPIVRSRAKTLPAWTGTGRPQDIYGTSAGQNALFVSARGGQREDVLSGS